jgi:hypothetical protein
MKHTEKEAWRANSNKLFRTPAHFHFYGFKIRLVYLFVEHIFPNLHCRFWNLPGIGAARDKLGSVGAKFYSPDPRISCATRASSVTSGGGRHYHFDFTRVKRSLMTLFDIATVAWFLAMACAVFMLTARQPRTLLHLLLTGIAFAVANQLGNAGYYFLDLS